MKKIIISLIALVVLVVGTSSIAQAAQKEVANIWWLEDAMRYSADGTLASSWVDDRIGDIEFRVTGKAYHAGMEWFYNYYPLANFTASPLVISGGNSKLAAWARYTSPRSGLSILDKIRGRLTINSDEGTAYGSYAQYSYIESCDEEAVHTWYPSAMATDELCIWYGGWTDYVVHGQE